MITWLIKSSLIDINLLKKFLSNLWTVFLLLYNNQLKLTLKMFKKLLLTSFLLFSSFITIYPSKKENTNFLDYCYSLEKIISRNSLEKAVIYQIILSL